MSEKNSWGLVNFIAIIILGAILVIGGSLLGNSISKKQAEKSVAGITNQLQPVVEKTISYDGQDNKTALELLKASHTVTTQDSSVGTFVTGIDGTQNTDTKYWMFYVNGELSFTGTDTYQTKNGEKIEMRYESLQ